jgi:hypothetical protein
MRKAAPKSHCHRKGVLVALALAVGMLALFLPHGTAKADAPPFNVTYSVTPASTGAGDSANLVHDFDVGDNPWPAAMYENQITFIPQLWGVASGPNVPIGAIVGNLSADSTLGWFNSPCSAAFGGSLHIDFDPMLNCSTDTSDTVTFAQQFADDDANGIQNGCDKYPDFLNTMFPGITPKARMGSFEFIGINVSLNFLVLTPGTTLPLPGMPAITPDLGYLSVSVLNDPTAPLVPNQITDICPPLGSDTTDYAITLDNPLTAADESGYAWRTNPQYGGTYTFKSYTSSFRDADDDDIDNEMDTCPHTVDALWDPRAGDVTPPCNPGDVPDDDDCDGMPDSCDPDPTGVQVNCTGSQTDCDNDGFPNRQDNCPLVSNATQTDGDYDSIGDACDQDDWNNDGDTTDPGEPTGFNSSTPDGPYAEVWIDDDEVITGAAVGGLAQLPDVSDSSSRNYIALAGLAAATLVVLSAGTWYARRRWLS